MTSFFVTIYIYPLPEKIILSNQFNFALDNPRSEDEVSTVKRYLLKELGDNIEDPTTMESFEHLLLVFRDGVASSDEYATKFFEDYKREEIIDFIVKMWVIARYEADEEPTRDDRKTLLSAGLGKPITIWLEEEHIAVNNSGRLVNYSYLLSLLAHTEGESYFGRCIILDPDEDVNHFHPIHSILIEFYMFGSIALHGIEWADDFRWTFLPAALHDLQRIGKTLDEAFENGLAEKLLYIGGILKIVSHDVRDVKVALIMLTSIIELILTHNPNTNRFNVEDSISKQFQLKASTLIYLNNKRENINHIKQRLKRIYEQRSNVAHGNFGEIHKYVSKLSKKEGEEEYFEDLTSDLYRFTRAIIEEYLKDRELVEFLKQN